jgi:ferredoxin-NADP reductase
MTVGARIAAIRQETPTIRSFTLELEVAGFSFLPGQWVDFYREIGGRAQVAGYSITSVPSDTRTVELAVKRVGHSLVTRYLHETVAVGDQVYIDGGYGDFNYTREMGDSVVLIAGGIGITPFLSIIRHIDQAAPDVRVTLVCSASTPDELLRREELLDIERRNPNVRCVFTVTRTAGTAWSGHTGRIDGGLLRDAEIDHRAVFFICGPLVMTESIVDLLAAEGIDDARVHYEKW